MDLKSIILVIGILIILIGAYTYFKAQHKKNVNSQLSKFMHIGSMHDLNIALYDLWEPGYAIGLDAEKKKLLYIQTQAEVEEKTLVDLAEIKSCHLMNDYRDVQGSRVIDTICLHLSFKNNTAKRVMIYNKEENLFLRNELQLAEKWNAIVQEELNKKKNGAHP